MMQNKQNTNPVDLTLNLDVVLIPNFRGLRQSSQADNLELFTS